MDEKPHLPVVADWFRVTWVTAGIALITEPHVDGLLRANAWYVRGRERDLVVDTGNGIAPLRPVLEKLARGRRREVVAVAHARARRPHRRPARVRAPAVPPARTGRGRLIERRGAARHGGMVGRARKTVSPTAASCCRHCSWTRCRTRGSTRWPSASDRSPPPASSRAATSSTWATGGCSSYPCRATRPAASDCSTRPAARCSAATRSTTAV